MSYTTRVGFVAFFAMTVVAFSSCPPAHAHSSPISRILHSTRGPQQTGYLEPASSSTGSAEQPQSQQPQTQQQQKAATVRYHPVNQHGSPLGPSVRMRV